MKNKFLGGIALLTFAAVAALNVDINSKKSDLSDVVLESVEALAQENIPGGIYKDSSGPCPPPKEYKRWRSCPGGGELSSCIPSDC